MRNDKREAILSRVKNLVSAQSGVRGEDMTAASDLRHDVGFDSLDDIEFIMALEEEFQPELGGQRVGESVEIPEVDAQQFTTIGSIVDYLCAKAGVAA